MISAMLLAMTVLAADPSATKPPPAVPAPAAVLLSDCEEDAYPGPTELKELLSPASGREHRIQQQHYYDRPICHAKGVFRVNVAWQPDHALRMAFPTWRWFRITLWRGNEGVALCHYLNWNNMACWAAYAVVRSSSRPEPESYALCAMDEGRYHQLGPGTVRVILHGSRLTLARGDTWLLSAPMAEPPTETYLDMDAQIRGLRLEPCASAPEPALPPRTTIAQLDKPAEANWQAETPQGTAWRKLDDGGVEVTAEPRSPASWIRAAVCPPGLNEFLLELEDPRPGAGLFLADAQGNELCRLAFFRDQEKKHVCCGLLEPGNNTADQWTDLTNHPVTYVGKRQWVQLVVGWGVCKMAFSSDGRTWTQDARTLGRSCPPATQVGLYCGQHDMARGIRLRSMSVRRMDGLAAALPPEKLAALLQPPHDPGRVGELLTTLVAGPGEWPGKFQALADAARLANLADGNVAQAFAAAYAGAGRAMIREGHAAPLSALTAGVLQAPLAARVWLRLPLDEAFVCEATPLIYQGQTAALADLCRRVRVWHQPRRLQNELPNEERPLAELADWAASTLPRKLGLQVEDRELGLLYRPLLLSPVSKEGFNALSELEAALQGKSYREACQLITGQVNATGLGLAPDARDARLYCSYPAAVRAAIARLPELRQAMADDFGRLGKLRLQAAIGSGDVAAVEAVAVQFMATPAAAEARQWLGDRAVSSGQFAAALGHYRQAIADAPAEQRPALQARGRLAAALSGREAGSPAKDTVQLGSLTLPAAEFEQLVADLRRARAANAGSPGDRTTACPAPGRYQVKVWQKFDGQLTEVPSHLPGGDFDFGARHVAATLSGDRLLLCNRAQLGVFQLSDGKPIWQRNLGTDPRKQLWPLVPARPAVAGGKVFVRRLLGERPDIECKDPNNGETLWTAAPEDAVVCDPLPSGQELFALTARKTFTERMAVSFCRLDPAAGEAQSLRPIAEFRDLWQGVLPCQAVLADERLVATAAGVVFCCDVAGRVLWLRQQVCMPPRDATQHARPWYAQVHEPPLVVGQRAVVFQPGMHGVECLDLDTGRLIWQRTVPRLVRVVGAVADGVIVRAAGELLALEADSGKVAWRHECPDAAEGCVCGPPGGVLYVEREPHADVNAPRRPRLVWLDAASGGVRQSAVVEGPAVARPWLGPLFAAGERLWLMVGDPGNSATRDIWELVRQP